MIPKAELTRVICPPVNGKRLLLVLWYYCDESYDDDVFTVAGLVAKESEWKAFDKRWHYVPKQFGVPRFHSSALNRKEHEFDGWDDKKKIQFTKKIIQRVVEREAYLVSCSVILKPYKKLPELARERLGTPYELCFKHCVRLVAEQTIPRLNPNGQFSVIYDHSTELGTKPVDLFLAMKADAKWAHRHKLGTCAPGCWKEYLPLQPADAVAFDTFKLLHTESWSKARKSLKKILKGH